MNSERLKVCIVLPNPFDPNIPARPAVREIYGRYLSSLGHNVTWITPTYKIGKGVEEKFFKKVRVYAIPYPQASLLPLKIFNLSSYLIKEHSLLTTIFKEEKYDIIQVRNDIFGALLALRIGRKYGVPFVFQYSMAVECYKAHRYYFGVFAKFLVKYILHKADLIFPISKWMKEELIKGGISESKMLPLPMGVSPELFNLSKTGSKIREQYNLGNARVILYAGTIDKQRELDILLHAFSKVRGQQDNVKLLMVGKGNDKTKLEELASSLGIQDDIIFTGHVPYFDVPDYIAVTNVCLCPVPPLSFYRVSSPTKMFEYMACGKPVVANEEIPEQKEVIGESGGGVLVKFEAESFADGIIELLNNPERTNEMSRKGYEWVVKNRSYENMAREVEKRYYELLESYNNKRKIEEVE